MKTIFKISLLALSLVSFSAGAEICKEEYKNQPFNHVNIWKDRGKSVICYYQCSSTWPCTNASYTKLGYKPAEGPWVSDGLMYSCTGEAEYCHFKPA